MSVLGLGQSGVDIYVFIVMFDTKKSELQLAKKVMEPASAAERMCVCCGRSGRLDSRLGVCSLWP